LTAVVEEAPVPYELPNKLPAELLVMGKTYKLVPPGESVKRGVCKGNDKSWFYYFNKDVVDGDTVNIGNRRHFSVRKANGQRAVHISMKPHGAGKRDDIMIWYNYDAGWDGRKTVPAGWGRTPTGMWDNNRVTKAVDLLDAFLKAMDAVAKPPTTPAPPPTPGPALVVIPVSTAPPQPPPPPATVLPTVDSWEDL
jgi:hypothetical protein